MRAVAILLLCVSSPVRATDLFGGLDALANDLRGPDAARRREAVDRLDAYPADEARAYLLRALDDGDAGVRAHAAASIGRHHLREAEPRLVTLVEDADAALRASVVEALGELGAADHAAPPGAPLQVALDRALGDADAQVRAAAVAAFGRLAPARARASVVPLTARLDDENSGVRQRAAQLLGRIGDARAVIPLLARLADSSRDVRSAGLEALGELGDSRAAAGMIRLLGDGSEEVRAAAAQALGRLRAQVAIVPLVELLEQGSDLQRGRAAFALGQIGSAGGGRAEAVVAPLVAALAREELRPAAREALAQVGLPSLPALLARLEKAAGDERVTLVELSGEIGDARAVGPLVGELERGRLDRERVIDALASLARRLSGAERPIAELAALLEDREVSVRRRAARALRPLADRRAADALERAAADEDRQVRLAAIAGLGRLKAPSAAAALAHALESADEPTAAEAARALGELLDPRMTASLLSALGRSEARVRREAADAIARMHDPAALAPLLRLARTAPTDHHADLFAALSGVVRRRPDPLARELLLGAAESRDPASAEALGALAAMHDRSALPRLERLLAQIGNAGDAGDGDGSENGSLRRQWVETLGELGGDPGLLTARLEQDGDPRVRAEAAWALGKGTPSSAVIAALARALAAPTAAVRANAAASLARLGRTSPALVPLLHDADPAARANAALALARRRETRAALEPLRSDDDRRVRSSATRALDGTPPPALPATDWIVLHLVDFNGAPLPGARFRLLLPGGLIKSGVADVRGVAREESLWRGGCELELPDG